MVEEERVVAVVVDRAMGGIEVHARRLVAQGKTSSAEQNRQPQFA